MLEPCEGRLSSTVLRGLGASNGPWLPDSLLEFGVGFVIVCWLVEVRCTVNPLDE